MVFLKDMLDSVRTLNIYSNLIISTEDLLKQLETIKVKLTGNEGKTVEILSNTFTYDQLTKDHNYLKVDMLSQLISYFHILKNNNIHAYIHTYIHKFFYINIRII